MFVRKKKNRSGTTSVVVVDKHGGKFKELCTIGIGHSDEEIDALCVKGRSWIKNRLGILEFDFEGPENKAQELANAESMLNNIDSVLLNGAKLILEKVYNSIGFNRIADDTLRHLVVARLCQPMSKMATVDYLKSHFDEDVNLSKIYRYMDKLYSTQKDIVQKVSVEHTFSVLGGRVEMLFYDVTSLYFRVSAKTFFVPLDSPRMARLLRRRSYLVCLYARWGILWHIPYSTARNTRVIR